MPRTPHHSRPGAHELGQNHLRDRRTIEHIVEIASRTPGPLVEWGAGDGALTVPLARLGRPLEAIEIDDRAVRDLRRRVGPDVTVSCGDILSHAPPAGAVLVSNLPYHLTTPALRHLLRSPGWRCAVLVTQWEVARKRAGVGGATMLTSQWWPWVSAHLEMRIPATAFRPRPSVDSGLLVLRRRADPLLAVSERRAYQQFVRRIFTGPGRGIDRILQHSGLSAARSRHFLDRHGYSPRALPRDVDPAHWVDAFALTSR